jgi:hypothetical protein
VPPRLAVIVLVLVVVLVLDCNVKQARWVYSSRKQFRRWFEMLSPRVVSHLESPLFSREVPPHSSVYQRANRGQAAAMRPPSSWILAPSLPFLRPFPVPKNRTDPFHSGEHVINCMAASSYELCPDDFRDEITG